MRADALLLWLSARREGSWQQFRAAVEELHASDEPAANEVAPEDEGFPLHRQLRRDLERLGHVEFFARDCQDGWRVAPPILAAHPFAEGVRAVLCGARSPALCDRVLRAAEGLGYERPGPPGVPEVMRLTAADASTLEEVATQVGMHFQRDAPLAILSYLPPCGSLSQRSKQAEFPLGADWSIHQFDAGALRWSKADRRRAETARYGVFQFSLYERWVHFLRWAGATFELPRAIALYALLHRRRRRVLRYDIQVRELSVPAICRPPLLLERALVLCSGVPPAYDTATSHLTYADVPPDVAFLAAELLRQPLT